MATFKRPPDHIYPRTEEIEMSDVFEPYIAKDRVFLDYTFDFWIQDPNAKSWYDAASQQWSRERQWCSEHVRKGFNVVDCGAHHGMMTVLLAHMTGPTGLVHAWEALPGNADVIRKNAELNGYHNIVVHPVGVGERHEFLQTFINQGNVVVLKEHHDFPKEIQIEIVALDDDLPADLKVDFFKLDVEGNDLPALRGARRVLAQRPILMLEMHHFLYGDRQAEISQVLEVLEPCGYDYQVELFSGELVDAGRKIDPAWLAQFEHCQLFCTPASAS